MAEGLRRSAGLTDGSSAKIVAALQADGPLVALVAAFQNDAWTRPRDLALLTQAHPGAFEIFSPRCGLEPVADTVRAWLSARLAAGGL